MREKRIIRLFFLLLAILASGCSLDKQILYDEHGQIPPGLILSGTYSGELEFYEDATSAKYFSRAIASLSERGDLFLKITDQVSLQVDTTDVQLESIVGILSSRGEFFGNLNLDNDSTVAIHARSIPDTLLNDALKIEFTSLVPFGMELIDSISCVLYKN